MVRLYSPIVAHDPWLLLAKDAPLEPEKVQLALFAKLGASGAEVMPGAGSATGEAIAEAARAATTVHVQDTMMTNDDE